MKSIPTVLGIITFCLFCISLVLFVTYPITAVVNGFWAGTLGFGLLWAFFSRKSLFNFLTKKSTRYGANLSFVVFLVLGILVFLNVLGKEFNWRKDLTRASSNSLSPQTKKVLQDLSQPVKAYYFGSMQDKDRHEPLLKNYSHTNKKFEYEFVDVSRRPTFTQSMDVKKLETVVLVLGETKKKVKIEGVSEEKVTNGLIRLLRNRDQFVYFTSGHGERSLSSSEDPLAYSALKEELEKQGYTARELNLFSEGKIPSDASLLVVAGPSRAFFPKELEVLSQWMNGGGRALLAVDLSPSDSGLSAGSRQLVSLLKPFGVAVQDRMLVDPTSRAANMEPQVLLGFSASKDHPITKDFPSSVLAANFLFPLTTHLVVESSGPFKASPLVLTSQNAWAESDWASLKSGVVSFQEGQDKRGQMVLAAAIESGGEKKEGQKQTRLVVFAASTFVTNSLVDKVGNRDLFLNSVAWLSDEEQLISIRAKEEDDGLKQFDNKILNLVLLISVLVVPVVVLGAGIVVWMRRSKL